MSARLQRTQNNTSTLPLPGVPLVCTDQTNRLQRGAHVQNVFPPAPQIRVTPGPGPTIIAAGPGAARYLFMSRWSMVITSTISTAVGIVIDVVVHEAFNTSVILHA